MRIKRGRKAPPEDDRADRHTAIVEGFGKIEKELVPAMSIGIQM
jgi:hypothetical protein